VVANDKMYDRSTSATFNLSRALLVGVLSPEDATISAAGMFANANVGTWEVAASGFRVMNNTNYTLHPQPDDIPNATIYPKASSVTALDNIKTVGELSDPPLSTTNSGLIPGDLGAGKITFSATQAPDETVNT
jgi:hypothetical protein